MKKQQQKCPDAGHVHPIKFLNRLFERNLTIAILSRRVGKMYNMWCLQVEASLQTGTDETDPNPLPPPLMCSADNTYGQKAQGMKLHKIRIVPLTANIERVEKYCYHCVKEAAFYLRMKKNYAKLIKKHNLKISLMPRN